MKTETLSDSLRFEVLLDGKRVAVAGVEEFGVLVATITWVRRSSTDERCELELGGLNGASNKHLFWAREALRVGSEVTVRLLPSGNFDLPTAETRSA